MTVLDLPAAKKFLQIGTDDSDDDLILALIPAAEAWVEERVGPLVAVTKSARVSPVETRLSLPDVPVVELTTVTASEGGDLDTDDLHFSAAGVVTFNDGSTFTARWYDVTYKAGWGTTAANVSKDLVDAICNRLDYLFQSQRGSAQRGGGDEDDPQARAEEITDRYTRYGFS